VTQLVSVVLYISSRFIARLMPILGIKVAVPSGTARTVAGESLVGLSAFAILLPLDINHLATLA